MQLKGDCNESFCRRSYGTSGTSRSHWTPKSRSWSSRGCSSSRKDQSTRYASITELQKTLGQVDAVIFAAGSRGKDLLQVDLNGSVKLAEASRQNGIKRFIQLSSAFALEQDKWAAIPALKAITDYNIAKFYADRWLIDHPGLDWTIIQAGVLDERPATGMVALNDGNSGHNAIPDVAAVLVKTLEHSNTIGKVIMMHDGSQSIDAALSSLK